MSTIQLFEQTGLTKTVAANIIRESDQGIKLILVERNLNQISDRFRIDFYILTKQQEGLCAIDSVQELGWFVAVTRAEMDQGDRTLSCNVPRHRCRGAA